MIWCVNVLLLLNIIQASEFKLMPFSHGTTEDQIRLYCSQIHTAFEDTTLIYRFSNCGGGVCRELSSCCLESHSLPKIVRNEFSPESLASVVFSNDSNNILTKLTTIVNTRAVYHIIFCTELNDGKAKEIAEEIWNSNLAYFVVVYVSGNRLKVISYDGYSEGKPLLNFTNNYKNVFARRRKSLNGHSPSYLTADTYPITVYQDGHLRGEYIELIEALGTCLHSEISQYSFGFMGNLDSIDISYLFKKDSLICIKPIMYTEKSKDYVTYPIDIKDFVVLVPIEKVENKFNYIFSILTYKIIICFLVILATMSFLNKNLTLGYNIFSFHAVLFDYFGSFLGLPIEKFEVKRSVMLLSWLIFSLVVTVQFKGIFLNDIFNMQHEHKINTIEELKAQKMNIYISFEMTSIKNHDNLIYLKDQVKFVSPSYIVNGIINNSNHAYAVIDTMAKGFLNLHVRHLINFKYRVMDEKLASFLMAHPLNSNSPLIEDINLCILRAREAGVQKSSFVSWPKYFYDNNNRMMTSVHFAGCFILLFIGYLISSAAFVVELVLGRLVCRKKEHVIVPYLN